MAEIEQSSSPERKLAAIMFTDIVGYTAIMGKDEESAMELIRKNRAVQSPIIQTFNGSLLKEMGDGNLVSFRTASEAIYCAIKIQKHLHSVPDLNLRIGIHLGEIMVERGDVFGDGVNIASRLQSIAEPGGIYISDAVQKAVRGKRDIQYAYLGELDLRNVDYPVKTYAIRGQFLPRPKKSKSKQLSGTLLANLNQRGVLRSGLAYAVLGTVVILALPYAGSLFSFPAWVVLWGSILVISGFPVAVYLAWNYERSPEGIIKVSSRLAWENPYSDRQKKPLTGNLFIGFLMIVLIGIVTFDISQNKILHHEKDLTIAIIPFLDNSGNEDLSYYGMGMASEVRSTLSQSKLFEFISAMQATRSYSQSSLSPKEIGAELGVKYLIMGMYQIVNDRIKVDVELVETETGNPVWNHSFNELFTDVFHIQSRIADEVLQNFSNAEFADEAPTNDLEAYKNYIQALEIGEIHIGGTNSKEFSLAIDQLRSAIRLDSNYIDAWVALIDYECNRLFWGYTNDPGPAESALTGFEERFPNSWKLYLVRGFYEYHGKRQYAEGYRLFKKALEYDPENSDAIINISYILKRQLRQREALTYLSKAIHQKPRGADLFAEAGVILNSMGDYENSEKAFAKASELGFDGGPGQFIASIHRGKNPARETYSGNPHLQITNKIYQRDYDGAMTLVNELDMTEDQIAQYKVSINYFLDRYDSMHYFLNKVLGQSPEAWHYAFAGDREKAIAAIKERIQSDQDNGDLLQLCGNYLVEVRLLAILNHFEEATDKLKRLNQDFPNFGNYGDILVHPVWDKIKKAYPPFNEVLANLKMPEKLPLEEIIEL